MSDDESPRLPRRHFLGSLALAGAAFARPGAPDVAPIALPPASGEWDDRWLKRLNAKHRVVFDCQTLSPDTLAYPGRYLDAMLDGYGARQGDVQMVIGLSAKAWPAAIDDQRWDRYNPAGHFGTNRAVDPKAIAAIQQRGAILLVCNNSLRNASRDLAANGGVPDQVYADLRAGILPGITVVPAMTAAIALAQEHRCVYLAA